jgi:hypothetical protein
MGRWAELAEHWLKVIAAWPMQASLVESIQQMPQILGSSRSSSKRTDSMN